MRARFSTSMAAIAVCAALGFGQLAPERKLAADMSPLPARDVIKPIIDCGALQAHDFAAIPGAPTRIISAKPQPATQTTSDVCVVTGYVAPQVQFELRLPAQTYTGRYLQLGCGGNCGRIFFGVSPACDGALAFDGSFAVAASNAGHNGANAADGIWAYNDPQLRIDFAYRGPHVISQAAKAIIAAYYGQRPAYSYFDGCSDGGREGLEEAQRYPGDFNGIVSGSPAHLITEAMERFIWEARNGLDANGNEILSPQKLNILHGAVMQACDALDGLADNQIDDPRMCHYDPGKLECSTGNDPSTCLTSQEVNAARKFYEGPATADGKRLYPGGEPYGSEMTWAGPGSFTRAGTSLANEFLKYMVYGEQKPPSYSWREWKFDLADFRSLVEGARIYDANNPDLSGFRQAGGKLIIWQGWADNAAGAFGSLDYYQAVQGKMGGLAATQRFARVFMIPGVYHCRGGYMPYEEDLLGTMIAWVESETPPDAVIAAATMNDGKQRRRRVYAYPTKAKYKGSGDINDPANFVGVAPSPATNDHFDWVGPLANRL